MKVKKQHIHMMVTEGDAGKDNPWKHIRYFLYEMLRKRWQKLLLFSLINKCRIKEYDGELKLKKAIPFYTFELSVEKRRNS